MLALSIQIGALYFHHCIEIFENLVVYKRLDYVLQISHYHLSVTFLILLSNSFCMCRKQYILFETFLGFYLTILQLNLQRYSELLLLCESMQQGPRYKLFVMSVRFLYLFLNLQVKEGSLVLYVFLCALSADAKGSETGAKG